VLAVAEEHHGHALAREVVVVAALVVGVAARELGDAEASASFTASRTIDENFSCW
jgi:hypothetical protein